MSEKPLREIKGEAAQAVQRSKLNGQDLRKIEQTLKYNLKRLRELRNKNA